MRMKVILENGREFVGQLSIDSDKIFNNLDRVQDVVDTYEDRNITIDQGGDDDWYEFDIVDPVDNDDVGFELLSKIESIFKE